MQTKFIITKQKRNQFVAFLCFHFCGKHVCAYSNEFDTVFVVVICTEKQRERGRTSVSHVLSSDGFVMNELTRCNVNTHTHTHVVHQQLNKVCDSKYSPNRRTINVFDIAFELYLILAITNWLVIQQLVELFFFPKIR